MLSHKHFEYIDELFDQAIEQDETAQERFIDSLAGENPELAHELRELIAQFRSSDTFLSLSAWHSRDRLLAAALDLEDGVMAVATDRSNQVLGSFRLDREIARGYRAVVYKARRIDTEWEQVAAIKVLQRGVDSDDVLRRFLAERQILTLLDHPHIATLMDGGRTEDGLPYFVMEYIEGRPVTDYCAERNLPLKTRLELCRQICSAVAFAHRHLVVHRDLKPSNILVTDAGQVKLLDFGIAKLLGSDVDPAIAAQTVDVVRPMTPRYASPEQVAGEAITSATDVYQLGLLFTEILTGVSNARDALGLSGGPDRHQAPPRTPSRAMLQVDGASPFRPRELRGDLDWILLKALEPRPEDRYASAAELDADLENYLSSRAVNARQATAPYLLRKFARRRPVLSAALGLSLAGGLVFILVLAHFNRQLEAERQSALDAAARAAEVRDLLVGFIRSPDPWSGSGADARVSDILQHSEATIETQLEGRPELQVVLYGALADVYQNLAAHERSVALREKTLALHRTLGTANSFASLQAQRKRAQSQMVVGETRTAVATLERLLARIAQAFPDQLREAALIDIEIGRYHNTYGRAQDALPHGRRAVETLETEVEDPSLLAQATTVYGNSLGLLGQVEEAYNAYARAHEINHKNRGEQDVATLISRARIAANLSNQGRYAESIAIYDEILPPLESRLGPLHEEVLAVMNNVAYSHSLAGNRENAIWLHRGVLERRREKFGDTHRQVADSLQNIGSQLVHTGRYDQAIAPLEEAGRIYALVNAPGHSRTAYPHVSLAIAYAGIGADALQEQHARKALTLLQGQVSDDHPALLRARCLLGDSLVRNGEREQGISLLERAVDGLTGKVGISGEHLEACREALTQARQS
ncbi:serine/threonine-protein kinase [Elongatibacter sediminis]|uniref:Serine/threonine-protein kinase n=1 Tax=Elongatibacter sediminis TaxID=3119006 RepID=A0AAW9RKK5_9GAMM